MDGQENYESPQAGDRHIAGVYSPIISGQNLCESPQYDGRADAEDIQTSRDEDDSCVTYGIRLDAGFKQGSETSESTGSDSLGTESVGLSDRDPEAPLPTSVQSESLTFTNGAPPPLPASLEDVEPSSKHQHDTHFVSHAELIPEPPEADKPRNCDVTSADLATAGIQDPYEDVECEKEEDAQSVNSQTFSDGIQRCDSFEARLDAKLKYLEQFYKIPDVPESDSAVAASVGQSDENTEVTDSVQGIPNPPPSPSTSEDMELSASCQTYTHFLNHDELAAEEFDAPQHGATWADMQTMIRQHLCESVENDRWKATSIIQHLPTSRDENTSCDTFESRLNVKLKCLKETYDRSESTESDSSSTASLGQSGEALEERFPTSKQSEDPTSAAGLEDTNISASCQNDDSLINPDQVVPELPDAPKRTERHVTWAALPIISRDNSSDSDDSDDWEDIQFGNLQTSRYDSDSDDMFETQFDATLEEDTNELDSVFTRRRLGQSPPISVQSEIATFTCADLLLSASNTQEPLEQSGAANLIDRRVSWIDMPLTDTENSHVEEASVWTADQFATSLIAIHVHNLYRTVQRWVYGHIECFKQCRESSELRESFAPTGILRFLDESDDMEPSVECQNDGPSINNHLVTPDKEHASKEAAANDDDISKDPNKKQVNPEDSAAKEQDNQLTSDEVKADANESMETDDNSCDAIGCARHTRRSVTRLGSKIRKVFHSAEPPRKRKQDDEDLQPEPLAVSLSDHAEDYRHNEERQADVDEIMQPTDTEGGSSTWKTDLRRKFSNVRTTVQQRLHRKVTPLPVPVTPNPAQGILQQRSRSVSANTRSQSSGSSNDKDEDAERDTDRHPRHVSFKANEDVFAVPPREAGADAAKKRKIIKKNDLDQEVTFTVMQGARGKVVIRHVRLVNPNEKFVDVPEAAGSSDFPLSEEEIAVMLQRHISGPTTSSASSQKSKIEHTEAQTTRSSATKFQQPYDLWKESYSRDVNLSATNLKERKMRLREDIRKFLRENDGPKAPAALKSQQKVVSRATSPFQPENWRDIPSSSSQDPSMSTKIKHSKEMERPEKPLADEKVVSKSAVAQFVESHSSTSGSRSSSTEQRITKADRERQPQTSLALLQPAPRSRLPKPVIKRRRMPPRRSKRIQTDIDDTSSSEDSGTHGRHNIPVDVIVHRAASDDSIVTEAITHIEEIAQEIEEMIYQDNPLSQEEPSGMSAAPQLVHASRVDVEEILTCNSPTSSNGLLSPREAKESQPQVASKTTFDPKAEQHRVVRKQTSSISLPEDEYGGRRRTCIHITTQRTIESESVDSLPPNKDNGTRNFRKEEMVRQIDELVDKLREAKNRIQSLDPERDELDMTITVDYQPLEAPRNPSLDTLDGSAFETELILINLEESLDGSIEISTDEISNADENRPILQELVNRIYRQRQREIPVISEIAGAGEEAQQAAGAIEPAGPVTEEEEIIEDEIDIISVTPPDKTKN